MVEVQPLPELVTIIGDNYTCSPCKAICNTRIMLDMHLSGKNHAKRINALGGPSAFQSLVNLPELTPKKKKPQKRDNPDAPEGGPKKKTKKEKIEGEQKKFHCDFCDVYCDTEAVFESHRNGNPHAKKVRQIAEGSQQPITCDICNVSCNSQAIMDTHLNGIKHKKAIGEALPGHQKKALPKVSGPVDPKDLFCQACNLTLNGPQMMLSHISGKAHKKKLEAANRSKASAMATSLIDSVRNGVNGTPSKASAMATSLIDSVKNGIDSTNGTQGVSPAVASPAKPLKLTLKTDVRK